jgi:uncharacterized protein YjdB
MTKTRLFLLSSLTLTIAACGGRSSLRVEVADGGATADGAAGDAKRDGVADGASLRDGPPSVVPPDAAILDDAEPDVATGGSDGRAIDGQAVRDVRPGDGGSIDVTRPDGGPGPGIDGRTGGPDGRIPGDGITTPGEVGRGDAVGRTDQSIGRPDGGTSPEAAPVTLTSIEIYPASPITVNVGTPRTLIVTANYSDNTSKDVSSAATVASANTSVLTVSGTTLTGLGTTVATTTITVSYGGQTLNATVIVNGTNPLVSISIENVPTTPLAPGATRSLRATGVFTDGTRQDVTADATWASSAASVATVGDTAATKGVVTAVAPGSFYVTATVGTIVGTSGTMTVSTASLVSIAVTSDNGTTLQRGLTNQVFRATGTYDDGSTGDVTRAATWSSSNTSVLTVVATGATAGSVTTVAAGTATVTATVGSISGTLTITVTAAALRSITITGSTVVMVGNPSPSNYVATGNYADGSTVDLTSSVTWASSDTSVLTISNAAASKGQATGVTAGRATIQATSGNITGRLAVTVSDAPLISITLSPTTISNLIVGLSRSIKATGLYGDASNPNSQFSIDVTTAATWTVDNSAVATVGNGASTAGQVTGVGAGSATVTAALSGQRATASVTVVTATLLSITVSPSEASVRVGRTYPFTARGTYDNGTTDIDITDSVTWTSSDTGIATISNAAGSNGVATGVAASSTVVTITATLGSATGTARLTVNEAQIVSIQIQPQATQTIEIGATQTYTVNAVYENGTTATLATGVSWASSNPAVATIATAGGRGGGPGGGGAVATAVAAGNTTIQATYTTAGGTTLSDSVTLVVSLPVTVIGIRITPTSATIRVGETQTYQVWADYSDGSTATVTGATLTSSNGNVASVGGGGRGGGPGGGALSATGLAQGSAVITASYVADGTTFTATSDLTVNPACTVASMYITPTSATVLVNGTQQFRAWAVCAEDGSSTDVTGNSSTAWTTSDGTKATVTTASSAGGRGAVFAPGGGGLATGVAAGEVTITAVYTTSTGSVVSATASLTVRNPTPTHLTINPTSATIRLDGTQNFTATLSYDDGSSANVTASASWSTSDPTVVVMTNASGGRGGGPGGGGIVGGGTAYAVGTGSATVTVTYTVDSTSFTATATVTVTNPTVASLELSPTTPTVYLSSGPTQQFRATVIFTDATRADVTTSATWSSGTPTVASISAGGLATGLATGSSLITASYTGNGGTVTNSTTLYVAARTMTGLLLQPTTPTTHLGLTVPFVATAVYDNGSRSTVTGSATWTSSQPGVATITSSSGGGPGGGAAGGVATPVATGSTTITASFGGYSATTTLTVGSGTLSSIDITPSPLTVAVGATQQLTATGSYSDGLTENLTNFATWLSTDSVATVSNASGSYGLLKGVGDGTANVRAVFQGVTGSLSVTVNATGTTVDAAVTD